MHVLSIQSWTVYGYVGNKCSMFALQLLGFDVDAIHSVQLSNHTGYEVWKGRIMDGDSFDDLLDGLERNDLLKHYTHILSGYVRDVKCLESIGRLVRKMKERNPSLIYVCDPVMGDNGKLYVPDVNVPVIRDQIVPVADCVFPNQTEATLLTGVDIVDDNSAFAALDTLCARGVRVAIISSAEYAGDTILRLVGVDKRSDSTLRWTLDVPKHSERFTGTGDLFSALMLAWLAQDLNAAEASERTVATIQAVLERTIEFERAKKVEAKKVPPELRLIQSKGDIEKPIVKIRATLEKQ